MVVRLVLLLAGCVDPELVVADASLEDANVDAAGLDAAALDAAVPDNAAPDARTDDAAIDAASPMSDADADAGCMCRGDTYCDTDDVCVCPGERDTDDSPVMAARLPLTAGSGSARGSISSRFDLDYYSVVVSAGESTLRVELGRDAPGGATLSVLVPSSCTIDCGTSFELEMYSTCTSVDSPVVINTAFQCSGVSEILVRVSSGEPDDRCVDYDLSLQIQE